MDAYTRWRDVFDAISPTAQSCLRDEIIDDLRGESVDELTDEDAREIAGLLLELLLDDSIFDGPATEEMMTRAYACLDAETARHVFAEVLIVTLEADMTLSDGEESCLRELVSSLDVAEFVSDVWAPSAEEESSESGREFAEGARRCVPEPNMVPDGLQLLWDFPTHHGVIVSSVVSDGVVIAGSYDGEVYALDADTGAPIWRHTTDHSGGLPMTFPMARCT